MNFLVLRPSMVPPTLLKECLYLQDNTTYLKGEFQKDLAPEFTDCLTSVAWIFRKCRRWELEWIANMPRKLLSHYQFDVAQGSRPGDVIFFSNRKGTTKHVGVFVTANDVFHCSKQAGRAVIEKIQDLFARRYQQSKLPIHYEITDPFILVTQIDPRTNFSPQTFEIFKKNKKAEKSRAAEQVNHTVLIINYNVTLNPQFLGLTPFTEIPLDSNFLDSVRCHESLLEFVPQNAPMDCSVTPPSTPPFTSKCPTTSSSVPALSIRAG